MAIALLEAKSAEKHPLVGKEQARDYAISLDIAYVILSNGSQHYVWDTRTGNPVRALSLPSPQAIASINRSPPRQRASLWTTPVDADYLQQKAQADRAMRDYQVAAIAAIRQRAQEGETAFLLEMATGTGKTTVAAALCFLYLNTGNARRILFLVDRIELRQQAVEGINDNINRQYTVAAYEGDPDFDWERTRIAVATVQSLEALTAAGPLPRDQFDLIIADEAHRCISGPNHAGFLSRSTPRKSDSPLPRAISCPTNPSAMMTSPSPLANSVPSEIPIAPSASTLVSPPIPTPLSRALLTGIWSALPPWTSAPK